MSRWEWATRVYHADGVPEIAPVDSEDTARWAYDLMRRMPFPHTTSSGRTATGVEMVVRLRDGDGEWQVAE